MIGVVVAAQLESVQESICSGFVKVLQNSFPFMMQETVPLTFTSVGVADVVALVRAWRRGRKRH